MDVTTLKAQMCARIDAVADLLIEASHDIHAHPELAYEEHHAHRVLTDILEREGVAVTRSAHGIDTAFDARAGSEGPDIAVCCEYDALPGVGHACGHNIIATAGLGAGLAAAALAEDAGGRVRILGTPAEEAGAGKVYMADAGAFDGADAALMVHPADADLLAMDAIAAVTMEVEWFGEASHAAAFPHLGRNALDAAVLGYMNVAALRQHIEATDRVHGIFRKGGDKPNIVPDHTVMEWMVRSARMASLEPLKQRVVAAWEAGGAATGCRCEYRDVHPTYADMVDNPVLAELYRGNATALGRPPAVPAPGARVIGSTDMGNVSYRVPSIHPMIAVAPKGVSIHSHEFTRHAASPAGDEAVLLGAKALAMTIADLWADRALVTDAQTAFRAVVGSPTGGPAPL